ncbi:MAG: hypothetical protein KKF48_01770 [Nanoarchaeota archaeon]|nr:hypothetical protein [Nanoarchaeota archaeon]MBU1027749.1 hypothetical protein [Nanoarchaeota archaeon]
MNQKNNRERKMIKLFNSIKLVDRWDNLCRYIQNPLNSQDDECGDCSALEIDAKNKCPIYKMNIQKEYRLNQNLSE